VDGVGKILTIKRLEIQIEFPKNLRRYLIPKGSIAVDGISMTVNRLTDNHLTLVVIPHTLQRTNLKAKRVGDPVNLEVDMVGKYVESLLYSERSPPEADGVSDET
jgi:riboflavin synthase